MLKELVPLISILMAGILVENYVLQQFLGICPFLGVSKKINQAMGMSVAVIVVMLFATAATWPIYTYILVPLKIDFLQVIVFILVIAALVQFVEIMLKRFVPSLFKALGVYLPLITTNCAVLGVVNQFVDRGHNFVEAMVASLGVGLGFMLAMVLFSGVRSRIEHAPVPKAFKNLPVTLIAASIVALAFFGFDGVVENILESFA